MVWSEEQRSSYRVQDFIQLVERQLHLSFYVRQLTTLEDLLALSRRIGAPLKPRDLEFNYRMLNQPWWPWSGWSIEARQHFLRASDCSGPPC